MIYPATSTEDDELITVLTKSPDPPSKPAPQDRNFRQVGGCCNCKL